MRCLNKQVSSFLRKKANGKISHIASIGWPDLLIQKPLIVYEQVCYTNALLTINFCIFDVKLCWQSNSGNIYKITDEDIDERDIVFWIENIDDKKFNKAVTRIFTGFNDANGQHPFFSTAWAALFRLYYEIEISDEFIVCSGNQLAGVFEQETKINIGNAIKLSFDKDFLLNYHKGIESGINACILLKYGKVLVRIIWTSASGRIYNLFDTDIDCDDIHFVFEGLDKEKCIHYTSPVWSLVTFPDFYLESIKFAKSIPEPVSIDFIRCYSQQLTKQFEQLTGFKANKETSLSIRDTELFTYSKGPTSRLAMTLYINHNWNDLFIEWKSLSGKIYEIGHTDINCTDIEFWFEGFDPLLYYKQMYPKVKLPFKLERLSYDLVVTRLNMDCTIEMNLRKDELENATLICGKIDRFIDSYNTISVKREREYGVIHNWKANTAGNLLIYEIDTGFTGARFTKKILQFLSGLQVFERVEVR